MFVPPPAAAEQRGDDRSSRSDAFWVVLRDRADLSGAAALPSKAARGEFVYNTLTRHADRAQAGIRGLLDRRGARYESYWITNALLVSGDADLRAELRSRPEVERIEPESRPVQPPAPVLGTRARSAGSTPAEAAVEWNIARVGADRVWRETGVRGEGIVVAAIDSGAQVDHPALSASYRGRYSHGAVNHDYHFLDLESACEEGCDRGFHGTHVMGVMAGRRADGPQIGVAPQARWIAAAALSEDKRLAAAQWMIAPTDGAGENPRFDLAPDVVNNSWTSGDENYFSGVARAWIAAGIFPVFAAGNSGAGGSCSTTAWPASLADAYAVGNTTRQDEIFGDSSRGPGLNGLTKPDIAAPGTGIMSSYGPTQDYFELTGTSQAAPHVAAAVALLWSGVPELQGDVAATRRLLDASARDIDDTSCGGTTDDNNAGGEGLLDIPALIRAAPRGGTGGLTGTVAGPAGNALPDAQLVLSGPRSRTLFTDSQGAARLDRMVPGTYTYRATAFGHEDATGTVTVQQGRRVTLAVRLTEMPSATLTGRVGTAGGPDAGAAVAVTGTAASARTDASGNYRLRVPLGTHDLTVTPSHHCWLPTQDRVTVTGDQRVDLDLTPLKDLYGYTCTRPVSGYRTGTTKLDISGSTGASTEVTLPFPLPLYGRATNTVWISTNGAVGFAGPPELLANPQWPLPDYLPPFAAVYAFFSLLDVDSAAGVHLTRAADEVVVEWRNVAVLSPRTREAAGRLSVSLTMRPDGSFTLNYRDVGAGPLAAGKNALIGAENHDGTDAFAFGNLAPLVEGGLGLTIRPPAE